MPQIDIGAVLKAKAPRLARWIPRPAVGWLRRTIHEKEINHILQHYWSLPPQEFIRACFRQWQVSYSIEGLEGLDPAGRYLFVSNHPFGGMDGMMLADKLIDRFGDVRVVVNDLLMYVEPLRPLWIPVNKHGAQNAAYARKREEELFGERQILAFPAGLCSRRIDGCVADPEWKISFLKKAYASQRQIVPVFVEGRLSNFFYRIDRLSFNSDLLTFTILHKPSSPAGRCFQLFASASRFRLDPFGRAAFSRHAASRPLPAASVTIGYC